MLSSLRQRMWAALLLLILVFVNRRDCAQFNIQPGIPHRIVIQSNKTSSIYIQDVPSNIIFAVIQLHTQRNNLSISTEPKFDFGTTKTGTNVGLATMLVQGQTQFLWYVKAIAAYNLTAVAYIQLYTEYDPVPGGCNQVFSLAIDPSIVVTANSHTTNVWFQWSNLASASVESFPDCENITVANTLSYDVYVSFVQQRDFSEDSYLSSIEDMLSPDSIIDNGVNVFSVEDSPTAQSFVTVTSEENQGALYAVVVTRSDTKRQAAYVTAVTYACDIENNGCSSDSSILEIIFATVACCCGLFLLLLGHSFLKCMLFLFGLIYTSLLAYILLSLSNSLDDSLRLPIAMALGLVGGCIWLTYWYFCAFPIISVLVPGMCAGYMIAAVLFFTPFGNFWWWDTSLNYAIAFVCAVLIFTVMLMVYQKVLSIISCGIVGAFIFLMCMAIPLRSSLRLIFLNALYHQTKDGYVTAKVVAPFHLQDIILSALWPVLIIAGVTFQFYRSRNQASFEIPARHLTVQPQVPHRYIQDENDDDERASLLPRYAVEGISIPDSYQTIPSSNNRRSSTD
uniref:TM7S3/TM198-like domain-containing protein n=1 Tax=Arion vulgaris TaxID=1028688 RepID=A0A0B6ZVI6_9EUPU